ncbi:hypothetical protein U1Q18_010789, partial [Sarracenia purpurea var. burkii]
MYTEPSDPCDSYGHCGPNAVCTINNDKICSCLIGYMPRSPQDWEILIWSGGCVRTSPLNCPDGEGFIKLEGVAIPDLLQFSINMSMTLKQCEVECLRNCTCTAYAYSSVTEGGTRCLLWYGNLIDIKQYANSGNQNLHIRVTASELDSKKKQIMLVMIPLSLVLLFLLLATCIIWKRKRRTQ